MLPSLQEVLVILLVTGVLFSAKLPALGRQLGQTFFFLKKSAKETKEELDKLDQKKPPHS